MKTQFVYIDSSQQQIQNQDNIFKRKRTCPEHCSAGFNIELCSMPETNYDVQLKNLLIKAKKDVKTTKGRIKKGKIPKMQKELEQNIDKRQSNYEYFAWKMEMDKKYDEIMNDKVMKLKIENERKKMVLIKQKAEDKMKKEENELKSYTIKKKQNQAIIVNKLQQQVRKLGVERITFAHEKVKEKIQSHKTVKQNDLISKQNKHKNQLQELRQKYESMREQKKLNELDQRKVIKHLEEEVKVKKKDLAEKLKKKKDFKV